jgi:putative Ca2+/H+ antiporter (TMEM165/GDT1 family)
VIQAFFTALGLVFVAELGDKSQLVAVGLGARNRFLTVVAGITVGFAAVNLLSVGLGTVVGAALPGRLAALLSGLLFLGFAAWTIRDRDRDDEDEDEVGAGSTTANGESSGQKKSRQSIGTVAVAIFVAELGDKTMLVTAGLAASSNPISVWVGATLGAATAAALGALLGRFGSKLFSAKVTRYIAAALFTLFGLGLIISAFLP